MKNRHLNAFWIGFIFTTALAGWTYWLWRKKRVVAPRPLVVSRLGPLEPSGGLSSPPQSTDVPVSDPLEEIRGIGPVFANRLNDAGIFTFEQLASTPPEDLARITGTTRWDPVDWISEAKAMAAVA
jgi:hypothetical protein